MERIIFVAVNRFIIIAFLFPSIILFNSCADNRLYEENMYIPNNIWNISNRLQFDFDIQDTVAVYDIFTNLRITAEYPYSNIFILVKGTNPQGKLWKELLEYTLADVNGKWQGRGLGDLYDYRILHDRFRDMEFKRPGRYHFEISQVMRVDDLLGVSAMGLRVVKK